MAALAFGVFFKRLGAAECLADEAVACAHVFGPAYEIKKDIKGQALGEVKRAERLSAQSALSAGLLCAL